MTEQATKQEYIYLIAVLSISLIIVFPIVYFGIPDTIDLPQHYKFAQNYYYAISNGDLFPGWAGNENYGYGDIGIRFYPPLAYYFLAFGRILTGNWYDASWLTFMFWMFVGCLGMFYWARCWFSIKESSIIAGIYIFIPFHLHQLYTGFNQFSEFAAASLLTFCFAFLTRIFQRNKFSDILGLGCFLGLLILTHLPSTIVGLICIFIYFLTLIKRDKFIKPLFRSALAGTIALCASAFYWIRLVSEIKWLNHNSDRFSAGHFDFAVNFFPSFYFTPDRVFLSKFIVDMVTISTMLFFVSAFIYLIYKRKTSLESNKFKTVFQTVLPVGLFAFFMFTPLSQPIWEIVSPLQKIQFPIRWMPVAAMCGAMVCGATINYLIKENLTKRRICFYPLFIAAAFVLFFNLTYILHPTSYIPLERQRFETKLEQLPNEQSFFCWWTVWSKPEALETKEKLVTNNRQTKIIEWKSEEKIFEVSEGIDSTVRVATFYYPHWKATANGKPITLEKDKNGAIIIPVSAEKTLVKLSFQEPLFIKIGGVFSLSVWLMLALLLLIPTNRLKKFKKVV